MQNWCTLKIGTILSPCKEQLEQEHTNFLSHSDLQTIDALEECTEADQSSKYQCQIGRSAVRDGTVKQSLSGEEFQSIQSVVPKFSFCHLCSYILNSLAPNDFYWLDEKGRKDKALRRRL